MNTLYMFARCISSIPTPVPERKPELKRRAVLAE